MITISTLIEAEKPFFVGRFGSTELKITTVSRWGGPIRKPLFTVLSKRFCNNAGFFPNNHKLFNEFGKLMVVAAQDLDILASWRREEYFLHDILHKIPKIPLDSLDPFRSSTPWSASLRGSKVLVIHPFKDSIEAQYSRRRKIYPNTNILPEFASLNVLQSVQSIGGRSDDFASWFDALNYMKAKIREYDFDVALIGCGAYGFPLAQYIKSLGKGAIHMGGATQLLFGIMGNRWSEDPSVLHFKNESWIRPLPHERPDAAGSVESACYW